MRKQAGLMKMVSAFAANLSARRKAMGLTQEEFAEISGLSTNYIARLEIGTNTPSFATLIKLSEVLKMNAADLLATDSEPVIPSETAITVAALLYPLNDGEIEYVLSQLRNSVRFVLSHRKDSADS
jgi:transcriptional regulator with XRE-family HTH domain